MVHARPLKLMAALLAAPALLVLMLSLPAAAKTITYNPQTIYFTYCYSHPPAERIACGDTVNTKTPSASHEALQLNLKTISVANLDPFRLTPRTCHLLLASAATGTT